MFDFVVVNFISKPFVIICLRSEAVLCMDMGSIGCRVNGNIMVPHYNRSRSREERG